MAWLIDPIPDPDIVALLKSLILISNINNNCKIISLNHIKSENAIAMLKALGYSVIDYVEEDDAFIPKLDGFDDIEAKDIGVTIIKFPFGNKSRSFDKSKVWN